MDDSAIDVHWEIVAVEIDYVYLLIWVSRWLVIGWFIGWLLDYILYGGTLTWPIV